ncbi:MAG: hypothetical protein AAGE80_00440 [Pseudomonadota bacterium]
MSSHPNRSNPHLKKAATNAMMIATTPKASIMPQRLFGEKIIERV